ncbi:hypothetical protein ICE_03904 [Bacillus cereus BAG1X1-2]|nr:hypothetical protein ICE_03904 [Bacillus cereus BAG1X1-2]
MSWTHRKRVANKKVFENSAIEVERKEVNETLDIEG